MAAGLQLTYAGNLNQALEFFRSALELSSSEFNKHVTRACIGRCLNETGNSTEALNLHLTVLEYYTSIHHAAGVSEACNNIALTLMRLGRHTEALRYAARDLALCQSRKDSAGEIEALRLIGSIQESSGDLQLAEATHSEVLSRAEETQDELVIALACASLGRTLQSGRNDLASQPLFERSVDIYGRHHMYGEQAKALSGLVQVYKTQGQVEKADMTLQKQVEIFKERGYESQCCVAYANLAALRLEGTAPKSALEPLENCVQRALALKNQNSDCFRAAQTVLLAARRVLVDVEDVARLTKLLHRFGHEFVGK